MSAVIFCLSTSTIPGLLITFLSVMIDLSSSIERVEEFKYLGTTLTNQNSIQEEIKGRLKSRNAYYLSVQNLLSSSLLSKNLKIDLNFTQDYLIYLIVCCGFKCVCV